MKVYAIRHRITGKFSKGGSSVDEHGTGYHWGKRGKIWTDIGPLKLHLRQYIEDSGYRKHYKNNIPQDWIVVENFNGDWKEVQTARSYYPETKY